jgi:hypothetical protein
MNGDGGGGDGIPLGGGDGGPPGMSMMGGGGDGGPSYPDLSMSSDHPDMNDIPEEGKATIHFHKHSHTRERHPTKPGQHQHHVRLKVHSIKVSGGRKKVSAKQIAGALGEPGGDMSEEAPE